MESLYDALQAEFCPPLDVSLLAAVIADLGPSPPLPDQVDALRTTLRELASQVAAQHEHELADELDSTHPSLCITADEFNSRLDVRDETAESSTPSGSSAILYRSYTSPLGFLQVASPHLPRSRLRRTLNEASTGGDDGDMDIGSVVETSPAYGFVHELGGQSSSTVDDNELQSPHNKAVSLYLSSPSVNYVASLMQAGRSRSDQRSQNLSSNVGPNIDDDVHSVCLEPNPGCSPQDVLIAYLYYLVRSASRLNCLVCPPSSHVAKLWLKLIEVDEIEDDVWLWVEGDEACIQKSAMKDWDSAWQELGKEQRDAALRAFRCRLKRTQRASPPVSENIASRNNRIREATPEQRLAAISWLIYTSRHVEEADRQLGWSSRSRFSLGEIIDKWHEDMSRFGILPRFPERPEDWNRFKQEREDIGCTCINSLASVQIWFRMVAWLEGSYPVVNILDRRDCRQCKDRASADYDLLYDTDSSWDSRSVPMPLVFSLEALSFFKNRNQHTLLAFSKAMVSKFISQKAVLIIDGRQREIYRVGIYDPEFLPWINIHPSVGRKYLQRYACYLRPYNPRRAATEGSPDEYLDALPLAFLDEVPSLFREKELWNIVLIGTLAWILGSRFLDQPYDVQSWHGYWKPVLEGRFMEAFNVQPPDEATRILLDKLKRAHSTTQGPNWVSKWTDGLWSKYAVIMEFVKSRITDPKFDGCAKCREVYFNPEHNRILLYDQNNTDAELLRKHFGDIPDLTERIIRHDDLPVAGGMYAWIYKRQLRREDGLRDVAVKVFNVICYGEHQLDRLETLRSLRHEVRVWRKLQPHCNVVPLLGVACIFKDMLSAVSPWVSGGSLRRYLERNGKRLEPPNRYRLIKGVAEGVKHLHNSGIVHGDLSHNNILVQDDGTACLTDFSHSTVLREVRELPMMRRSGSTRAYPFTAPELIPGTPELLESPEPSEKSDIYSLGWVMLEILSRQLPIEDFEPKPIKNALHNGKSVPLPPHLQIDERDLNFIQQCCRSNPKDRCKITDVLDYIASMLLHDLQDEFCPPLDTSLLAAFVADLSPSLPPDQVDALRTTLKELASQAMEQREHEIAYKHEIAYEHDSAYLPSPTTDGCESLRDFCSVTSKSSYTSASSAASYQSLSSSSKFLRRTLPHIRRSRLRRAPSEAGTDDDGDDGDENTESVVGTSLTSESFRELEERSLNALDDNELQSPYTYDDNIWKRVETKRPTVGGKAAKRKNARGKTITLVDIRQRQRVPSPLPAASPVPDPWTQLSSLSEYLAMLLPPHPASFFQSHFHSPNYVSPANALRAALCSIAGADDKSSSDKTILSTILDVLRESPSYAALDPEQRSTLHADAQLALRATRGRGDDAIDIVWLLLELDLNLGSGTLDMGIDLPPSRSSAWIPPLQTSRQPPASHDWSGSTSAATRQLPSGPPPVQPPPGSTASKGPHPLAAHIPAYGVTDQGRRSAAAGKLREMDSGVGKGELMRPDLKQRVAANLEKRDELLREACKAWNRRNTVTRGGEVALYFAERAREFEEPARGEALNEARIMVESKRSAGADRNTIDLYGTTIAEAVVIVKEILEREGCSAANPLKIITGRGTHSASSVSVLKPAVRNALVQDGWNVGIWDGGLVVRGRTLAL